MRRTAKTGGLGLLAVSLALAATSAWADSCPGVGVLGPGGASMAQPQGAPGNCTSSFNGGGITLGGHVLGTVYDPYSNTIYTYDELGRLLSSNYGTGAGYLNVNLDGPLSTIADPLGHTTTFAYDALHEVIAVTDPLGATTHYTYDSTGRVVSVIDGLGMTSSYAYDSQGRMISATPPSGPSTSYNYDVLGQLVGSNTGGNTTSYSYSVSGDMIQVHAPGGDVTNFTYDAFDRLVSQSDTLPPETLSYTYDAAGHVISLTDSLGGTTTFAYDALGRVVSETDPLAATYDQVYDAQGNVILLVDPLSRHHSYSYDFQGRLLQDLGSINAGPTLFSYLSSVPEPQTWALMLLGAFGLGLSLRLRRLTPA